MNRDEIIAEVELHLRSGREMAREYGCDDLYLTEDDIAGTLRIASIATDEQFALLLHRLRSAALELQVGLALQDEGDGQP